jgi:hypothetical protein
MDYLCEAGEIDLNHDLQTHFSLERIHYVKTVKNLAGDFWIGNFQGEYGGGLEFVKFVSIIAGHGGPITLRRQNFWPVMGEGNV